MTLREPRPVVPAEQAGAVHFIAIGGAGMSGIAQLFHERGLPVSGCDQLDSVTLRNLGQEGIEVHVGHDPAQLDGVDTVVVSTAIRQDNVELVAARQRGLRVWHRSEALAALMVGRTGIAVAGTHGKTTTTGLVATLLQAAGADPSYVIGAPLASSGRSAHLGSGDCFVVEADESDGSFLQYPARIVVITNVEADHLDNWGDSRHYAAGFKRFATQPLVEAVIINHDDPGARELAEELRSDDSPRRILTYGESPGSDIRLVGLAYRGVTASATLVTADGNQVLELQVPGRHNLANAVAAYAVGRLLGLDANALLQGAQQFTGTLRRVQPVADVAGVRIYDDYGHHPTEIRAALSAARRVAGSGRLIACFQPHLYSRTVQFADQFGEALTLADVVVVSDIYGSREDPLPGVTGRLVADAAAQRGAQTHYVPAKADLPAALQQLVRPGDLVMTLGAGDVTIVGPMLAKLLA